MAESTGGGGVEKWSVPCGRIFGVRIRLHVFLPLSAVLAALAVMHFGWLAVLLAVLTSGPLLILTVLIHELGHVFAARRFGCSADHILLWPLGGLAFIGGGLVGPKQQIVISAAGPMTHLPMIGLWIALLAVMNGGRITLSTYGMYLDKDFASLMCVAMLNSNIAMFLFNLLVPCFPLDCSRILASLLLMKGLEPGRAAKVIVVLSILVLIALIGVGVWSFWTNQASSSMNLVLAFWLAVQTYKLHQAQQQGTLASDPLFADAIAGASRSTAGTGEARTGTTGNFQAFQGEGKTLGKSATSSEVCVGSLVALMIAVSVSQVGFAPCP